MFCPLTASAAFGQLVAELEGLELQSGLRVKYLVKNLVTENDSNLLLEVVKMSQDPADDLAPGITLEACGA